MKKHFIIKSAVFTVAGILLFTLAFCLGVQWTGIQATGGQLMMNLQVSNLIREGNIPGALKASETYTASNVSVLKDLDSPTGLVHVASKVPLFLIYRHQFVEDYKTDAAKYFSENPDASFAPEVSGYLQAEYSQQFGEN